MSGKKPRDLLQLERALTASGYLRIAGTDEAGRGCLAGPVFAAAVILPPGLHLPEIRDSKKLSPEKRERLFPKIMELAIAWSVSSVGPEQIDKLNIHQASLKAMQLAVEGLRPEPEFLLVDGRFPIPSPLPQWPLVKGDATSQVVAAASILAKVSRDRWMLKVARSYPGYGFERHKGYGTEGHYQAIRERGLTPIHRLSFSLS